jgi:TRAP-type mannitol/chloroaromatic compound transport system permease small subunit
MHGSYFLCDASLYPEGAKVWNMHGNYQASYVRHIKSEILYQCIPARKSLFCPLLGIAFLFPLHFWLLGMVLEVTVASAFDFELAGPLYMISTYVVN